MSWRTETTFPRILSEKCQPWGSYGSSAWIRSPFPLPPCQEQLPQNSSKRLSSENMDFLFRFTKGFEAKFLLNLHCLRCLPLNQRWDLRKVPVVWCKLAGRIFNGSCLAHQSFILGSWARAHLIINSCFALLYLLPTYLPLGLLMKISSRAGLWYSLGTQTNTSTTTSQFQHNLQEKRGGAGYVGE